jgi:hypothetical protein
MPFCIVLKKPDAHAFEDNRQWIRVVRDRFPHFVQDETDREVLAQDLAEDLGMTPGEYLERAIGIALEHETGDVLVRLGFWVETAELELPNFPARGIDVAIDAVMPLLGFLEGEGFVVTDPDTGNDFDRPLSEALREAYRRRQAQVERVAKIAGGTPG